MTSSGIEAGTTRTSLWSIYNPQSWRDAQKHEHVWFLFCIHLTAHHACSNQNQPLARAWVCHALSAGVYRIHLLNLPCDLLPILQISDPTYHLPSTPRTFLSQGKEAPLLYDLNVTAHIKMHYNSQFSHILSPSLDKKFFKDKNHALLRGCLPGSW